MFFCFLWQIQRVWKNHGPSCPLMIHGKNYQDLNDYAEYTEEKGCEYVIRDLERVVVISNF